MTNLIYKFEEFINQPNLIFNNFQTASRIMLSGIIVYSLLILIINRFGKRSIANFSMHDYVVTLALGSIVATTIISKDATLIDGLSGILILLLLQYLITLVSTHYPNFFKWINAQPKVLFLDGQFIEKNLIDNRITENEVYSAIRLQGQTTSDNIAAVLLESNGSLAVIKSISEEKRDEITRYL